MQQIFNFLIRNKNNILFLLLFAFSFFLTVQSHSYQKSKFISSANFLTGGIYSWTSDINSYFNLEEYNERLLQENQKLREQLVNSRDSTSIEQLEDTLLTKNYSFYTAEVINNNYAKIDNYLTIDKGSKADISKDMGVVTSKGIVGIVENVSTNYATVISILNSNSKINAQLKKSNHFGSLVWNGENPNIVQLTDVPSQAPVQKGDTIMTGGRSLIFPKGIPIGTIDNYYLGENDSYFDIDVRLFNDMTNIGYVYVINNNAREEIQELENMTNDE